MRRFNNGKIIIGHAEGGAFLPSHGLSKHPLYGIWQGMKKRCYRKTYMNYKYYGAIGIVVCDEWRECFTNFFSWAMANGWRKGLTLDRFPNKTGNYEPTNCRWADSFQQANNKTNNRLITYNGVTASLSEHSRLSGLNITTILGRIKAGWSDADAVSKPKNYRITPEEKRKLPEVVLQEIDPLKKSLQ